SMPRAENIHAAAGPTPANPIRPRSPATAVPTPAMDTLPQHASVSTVQAPSAGTGRRWILLLSLVVTVAVVVLTVGILFVVRAMKQPLPESAGQAVGAGAAKPGATVPRTSEPASTGASST